MTDKREENIKIKRTVKWLTEKVKESKTKGLLVGVSGGVDSAVVAFLIKKVLPEGSMGIIMPCGSGKTDMEDAWEVVRACGIKAVEIDLTAVHETLTRRVLAEISDIRDVDGDYDRMARANLKARLRMSTLYAVANSMNYLVVGTDNAAEVYVGYFTKYGDGGVDLLPIAHIKKREVRKWARILGVPDKIIQKTPSAGLWEGQTDEKEMGTTYDMVDDFLEGKAIPEKDRRVIERLHRVSEHKRNIPTSPPREWYE
jgi:NAD+ synthase